MTKSKMIFTTVDALCDYCGHDYDIHKGKIVNDKRCQAAFCGCQIFVFSKKVLDSTHVEYVADEANADKIIAQYKKQQELNHEKDSQSSVDLVGKKDSDLSTEEVSRQEKAESDSEKSVVNDPVNHPSHYTQYHGIEVIQLTEQMNFNLGNAVKYIARAGFKDPSKEIEDLEKAEWYLRRQIEKRKGEIA